MNGNDLLILTKKEGRYEETTSTVHQSAKERWFEIHSFFVFIV